uniref:Cystatin domain-containing protein n=1 Tax=Setaria viridis TaxID=4556 RepID=A0A4U6TKW7_SETVI|nr:hypothetical protein SEVIR_7G008100v2 [Setaria viridis]
MSSSCRLLLLIVIVHGSTPWPLTPIRHVNVPFLEDLGRWAVSLHTSQKNGLLAFDKLVSARKQRDHKGSYYNLTINAWNRTNKIHEYRALVLIEEHTKKTELLSFHSARLGLAA